MAFRRAIWHSSADSCSASRLACVTVFETGPEVSAPTLGLLRADAGKPKAERAFMAADETRAHITPPRKRAGAEAPAGSPERRRGRSAGPLRHSCGRSFRPPGMGFHTVIVPGLTGNPGRRTLCGRVVGYPPQNIFRRGHAKRSDHKPVVSVTVANRILADR